MAVSQDFLDYLCEQMEGVGTVTSKRMFGGAGLYNEGLFFAIVADDTLYLKVDDTNRPDFEARSMGAFKPFGEEGYSMSYYQAPPDIIEDRQALGQWARRAVEAAARSKKKPKGGKRKKK